MAQQTINIGTYANKGDGDPIRVAFTKVNANFTDLYARVVVLEGGGIAVAQDIQGDIFAQDSSLGYSSATNTHYGSFVGALDGDVTGSVFADNSKIVNELNWSPKFSLEEALSHAWKWQQSLSD